MKEETAMVFSILIFSIILANWIVFWALISYDAGHGHPQLGDLNHTLFYVNIFVMMEVLIPYGFYRLATGGNKT